MLWGLGGGKALDFVGGLGIYSFPKLGRYLWEGRKAYVKRENEKPWLAPLSSYRQKFTDILHEPFWPFMIVENPMIRTFIQMTSLILTLGASFFLLKPNLGLSPKTIAELSRPHSDYYEETQKSLSEQCAGTRVGFFLLLVSFILQLGNSLWPLRWKDFGIDWYGVFISIGFCIIVLTVATRYSHSLSKQLYNQSMQQIKAPPVENKSEG